MKAGSRVACGAVAVVAASGTLCGCHPARPYAEPAGASDPCVAMDAAVGSTPLPARPDQAAALGGHTVRCDLADALVVLAVSCPGARCWVLTEADPRTGVEAGATCIAFPVDGGSFRTLYHSGGQVVDRATGLVTADPTEPEHEERCFRLPGAAPRSGDGTGR